MPKKINLKGKVFKRLAVVSEIGKTKAGKKIWLCKCSCGNETRATTGGLMSGHKLSCGCLQKDRASKANTKHGFSLNRVKHPLLTILNNIRQRCSNPKSKSFKYYGGRGISVCDQWLKDAGSFVEWGIENGWKRGLEIDRVDNDAGYSPDNCRIVKHIENIQNARMLTISNKTGFRGVSTHLKNKFRATLRNGDTRHHIGIFESALSAAIARDEYILKNNLKARRQPLDQYYTL